MDKPDKLHLYDWDKSNILTEGFIRINITTNNDESDSNGCHRYDFMHFILPLIL